MIEGTVTVCGGDICAVVGRVAVTVGRAVRRTWFQHGTVSSVYNSVRAPLTAGVRVVCKVISLVWGTENWVTLTL